MSDNSLKAINKLLLIEGGFVNNSSDRGGPTNFGITQKVYDAYVGYASTVDEIQNMPIGDAFAIYEANYWATIGGDYITEYAVAYTIFDQGVNRGVSSALKQVCTVLGIPVTGAINSQIISSVNAYDPQLFVEEYLTASENFYNAIVARDPSQEKFINGWMNRVDKIRNYAYANFGQPIAMMKEVLSDNPWIYALPVLALAGVIIYYEIEKNKKKMKYA
jgi:lysozyme family protein